MQCKMHLEMTKHRQIKKPYKVWAGLTRVFSWNLWIFFDKDNEPSKYKVFYSWEGFRSIGWMFQ